MRSWPLVLAMFVVVFGYLAVITFGIPGIIDGR